MKFAPRASRRLALLRAGSSRCNDAMDRCAPPFQRQPLARHGAYEAGSPLRLPFFAQPNLDRAGVSFQPFVTGERHNFVPVRHQSFLAVID